MKMAADESNLYMVFVCQGAFSEALASGRNIKTEQLPSACIGPVLSLRVIAGTILAASAVYTNSPSPAAAIQFRSVIEEY